MVDVLHALKHYVLTLYSDVVVSLADTFRDLVATQPLADICVAFSVLPHQRDLRRPGEPQSLAQYAPCISRLQHNFCLRRQGEKSVRRSGRHKRRGRHIRIII